MENGYKLFDYDVGLNDIIQLLERKPIKDEVTTCQEIFVILRFQERH